MDDMNVEWLDQKSPQLTSSNPIFGLKLPKETCFPKIKSPFLNVV